MIKTKKEAQGIPLDENGGHNSQGSKYILELEEFDLYNRISNLEKSFSKSFEIYNNILEF